MPKDLKDFPRPPSDNGRGLHGSLDAAWTGGNEGYAYWINELVEMGVKWFKVLDDRGSSLPWCEKLLAAGIFPIVRILRRDPPPNDTPEPNPGHIGGPEEKTIERLITAGVRYFETNNEPNLATEWKHNAMPSHPLEAAKIVALNWLFDARLILSAGGLPGLPAISGGGNMDLMSALLALGRQDILLEGCWIALRNECQNRPLNFPDDPINRAGQALTLEQYDLGLFAQWAWWNAAHRRADTLDEINVLRANGANSTPALAQDHACFREFEYYDALAIRYLGRSIPIISVAGGYHVGQREDVRYPRVTPEAQRDQTVALFDYMQRQAPDYYFAAVPTLLIASDAHEPDAWRSAFWQRAFQDAPFGFDDIPAIAVPHVTLGDRLPVVDTVKAMQNLARRLPGAQPTPPIQPAIPLRPKPAPEQVEPIVHAPAAPEFIAPPARRAPADFPSWLRDTPLPTPSAPARAPVVEAPIAAPAPERVTPTIAAPEEMAPPTEKPIAPPSEPLAIPAQVEWDWRLDALGLAIEPAEIEPGQAYWKLVRAIYQGPGESNDEHQVYYTVVDQQNKPIEYQKVWQGWSDGATDALTNERGEANLPLWASFAPERGETGAYQAWVDGLPSDRVRGIGLPLKQHVSFLLTWKRAIATFLDVERNK